MECSGGDTHVTVSEQISQGEREREGEIDREVAHREYKRSSVKSLLEEDGLKLSVCSFLNVKGQGLFYHFHFFIGPFTR